MVAKAKHSAALVKRAQARDQRRTERTVVDSDERVLACHPSNAHPTVRILYSIQTQENREWGGLPAAPVDWTRPSQCRLQSPGNLQPPFLPLPLSSGGKPYHHHPLTAWQPMLSACAVHGGLRPRKPNPDHPDSLISYLGLPLFSSHLLPIPDSISLHPHSLFLFLGISSSLSSTPLTAPLVGAPVLPFAESTTAS